MNNLPVNGKVVSFTQLKGNEISETQNNAMESLREKMMLRKQAIEIANSEAEYKGPPGP